MILLPTHIPPNSRQELQLRQRLAPPIDELSLEGAFVPDGGDLPPQAAATLLEQAPLFLLELGAQALYQRLLGPEQPLRRLTFFSLQQWEALRPLAPRLCRKVTLCRAQSPWAPEGLYQLKLQGCTAQGLALLAALPTEEPLTRLLRQLYLGAEPPRPQKPGIYRCLPEPGAPQDPTPWGGLLQQRFFTSLDLTGLSLEQLRRSPALEALVAQKGEAFLFVEEVSGLQTRSLCWL